MVAGFPWRSCSGRVSSTRRQNWAVLGLVQILDEKLDNFRLILGKIDHSRLGFLLQH